MKRHYLELWLLLAVAFAAFAVASWFEMPVIAGHRMRSSGIAEALFKEKPSDAQQPDSAFIAAPEAMPCDTTSHVILLFGDSMLEGLGPRLAAYAAENGHELYTVIWYGSTSAHWGDSDRLRNYISKLKPSYIFICLGANELFIPDIAAQRQEHVKNILADIGDIPYIWIGPPNWKDDTGINDLIRTNARRGSYFRSAGMDFERRPDGAHPTLESAALWMDSVVRWMPLNAAHPIRLDVPAQSTAKATRVYLHKPSK